ncbi:hypothetical protein MTBBW1_1420012 [Desulfamplus magnetovallimortis]|uniref:Uncharacterized protein n=1 Tax=Desulfamplus magnetovallimortis TaxID=1246637 RepID=A0A1W1H846_9BACT|nr:hypothetical protein MTBBW1_1420012 [Desulfamplus magnetovallimortis]
MDYFSSYIALLCCLAFGKLYLFSTVSTFMGLVKFIGKNLIITATFRALTYK